jgi:hypothetical protein
MMAITVMRCEPVFMPRRSQRHRTLTRRTVANAPLIEDTLNARVAFVSRERDGLHKSLTTGQDGNNINTQAIRASLAYFPSDATEGTLSAGWRHSGQVGVLTSVIVDVPGTPHVLKDFFRVTLPDQESDLRSSRIRLLNRRNSTFPARSDLRRSGRAAAVQTCRLVCV